MSSQRLEPATGLLITLPIDALLFMLQCAIVVHFLYRIHNRELSFKIKVGSLCVMGVGLFGILIETLFILVDLTTDLPLQSDVYCFLEIYLRYIWFVIFEVMLYLFFTIRIYHTFKYSIFQIKKRHAYIIVALVCIFLLVFIVTLAISVVPSSVMLEPNIGYACVTDWDSAGIFSVFVIGQLITIAFNIFYASLFFYKLAKLREVSHTEKSREADERMNRIFQLMQKHTLLTVISMVITITIWLIFDVFALGLDFQSDVLFVTNIDMFVKSLCLILMFKFYERRFLQCCGLCLRCTQIECCCRKGSEQELFPYFNKDPAHRQNNRTIFDAAEANEEEIDDIFGEDVSVIIHEESEESDAEDDENEDEMDGKDGKEDKLPKTTIDSRNSHLTINTTYHQPVSSVSLNSMHSPSDSRTGSVSPAPSRSLPSPDFSIESNYHLINFFAKVSKDSRQRKFQLHDYNTPNNKIDAKLVFHEVEKVNAQSGECVLSRSALNADTDCMFSFIRKDKCKFPYRLAIRIYDHEKHTKDAHTLLKYVEWNLLQRLKSVKDADIRAFSYEPVFDKLVQNVRLGRVQKQDYNQMVSYQFGHKLPSASEVDVSPSPR